MDTCIKIMSVLCLIGWSYELCTIADTNPVVSFCTNSTSTSVVLYLDSSSVPRQTNITCFCELEVKVNGQVIIPPHRADLSHVGISANDSTFSPFPATQETWSGPKRLYVRYDTYDTAINEVCLEFKGYPNITVTCSRVVREGHTSTAKTYTETVNKNDNSQKVAIGAGTGVACLLVIVAVVVGVICLRRNRSLKEDTHSDDGNEEVENPRYEPHVPDSSKLNTHPSTSMDQLAVYYTSVQKCGKAKQDAGKTHVDVASGKPGIDRDYECVDEPAYDIANSTNIGLKPTPMNNYDKVTNTSTDIGVDEYGYNVTTQGTGDKRNLPTDNVYNRLS